MKTSSSFHCAGLTLVEVLLTAAISSLFFGMLLTGSIALQRALLAADYQATAQNDQLRLCDYLARDLQSASAVSILNGGQTIDVTLPGTNANILSTNLNIPVLGPLLLNETAPVTQVIHYALQGTNMIRTDGSGALTIAQNLSSFSAVQNGAHVTVQAAFVTKFSRNTANPNSTQITRTISLRNING